MELTKPVLKTRKYLDYHECVKYLEKKYNFDARNYEETFKGPIEDEWQPQHYEKKPHLDFWHWIIERYDYIHNGCFFQLYVGPEQEGIPAWVKEILLLWETEFKEYLVDGYLDMFVEW